MTKSPLTFICGLLLGESLLNWSLCISWIKSKYNFNQTDNPNQLLSLFWREKFFFLNNNNGPINKHPICQIIALISDLTSFATSTMTPVAATLCYQHVCSLTAVFTWLRSVWQETYTEIAGMQRFGAFYMDYLYTMENSSGRGIVWFLSLHQVCLQALHPFLIFLVAPLCSFFCLLWSLSFFPCLFLSSLSNKPPGGLEKDLVLFESQPPGPWPFLSSLSP